MTAQGQGQFEPARTLGRRMRCVVPVHCILALLCACWGLTGCARLQLPAIDPTGSSIFLPFPNTTQLNVPRLHEQNGQPGILPTPAFAAPAAPPPCLDGSCETPGGVCNLFDKKHQLVSKVHDHFRSPGKKGAIQLTPARVVAPVGGEVVLLAGICGDDGYLVNRQPLEWMLSPESVGTFIEVGDDSHGKLASLVPGHGPKVEKLDVDFARGRTSHKAQVITRGTPNCNDDIQLREGETWLSISSPSEGVSRVTVLAPDSDIWDRRRQTATIYWVDAEWQFPAPQIARSGEGVQLVTRVTKSENLVPATDWIVRYTITDPNVATFVPQTGSNVALIRVNADGQAIAQISAPPSGRGTTAVLIEVIRPADPSDNLPELILGRGQTMVTFSAPGLNLQAFGPERGSAGEQLTYVASLGNPGDIDAENVRLLANIPAGTRLVSAVPQPSTQTNTGLVWDQGLLAAGRQLDVSLVLEALQASTFDVVFQAEGSGGLSAQNVVRTEIVQASVEVRFAPAGGIAQAEVGKVVQYEIDVTNSGRQTLTDIRLLIESDPGLPEAYQGRNSVEQTIPILQPGETRSLGVAFNVQQEGQQAARLTVSSGNKLLAEKSTSILGKPPQPKQPNIGVSVQFPETVRVGQVEMAQITLRNPGEVKLSGLQVELQFDQALEVAGVDNQNYASFRLAADGRSAVWSPQDLLPRLPGDSGDMIRRLLVNFRAKVPVAQAAIQVRAAAAEGVQAEDMTQVRIVTSEVQPPPSVTPPATRTGGLEVALNDFNDPTIVGNEIRYGLRITNASNMPDRNVHVEMQLPQGVRFLGASMDGAPVTTSRGPDNSLIFPTIQYMRPGMSIDYILVVIPLVPQEMVLRSRAYSESQADPIRSDQTTTVNPR